MNNETTVYCGRNWQLGFWAILTIALVSMFVSHYWVSPSGPTLSAIPFFSSIFLFSCFVGAWAGLGSGVHRWFALCAIPPLLAWIICLAIRSLNEYGIFFMMVVSVTGFILVTTLVLRLAFGRLVRTEYDQVIEEALQFGIRDLFLWTTVIAILLAVTKGITNLDISPHPGQHQFILLSTIGMGSATVVNIWALFGKSITTTKMLAVFAMICIAALINYFSFDDMPWFFPGVVILCEVTTLALMYCLRQGGYRFVKRSSERPTISASI